VTLDDFVKLAPWATLLAAVVAFVGAKVAASTGARIAGEYKLESEHLAALRDWRRSQVSRVIDEANGLHVALTNMELALGRGDRPGVEAAEDAILKALDVLLSGWTLAVASPAFGDAARRAAVAAPELARLLHQNRLDRLIAGEHPTTEGPAGPLADGSPAPFPFEELKGAVINALRDLNRAAEEYVFERPVRPPWWRRLWWLVSFRSIRERACRAKSDARSGAR
jgi:hypothetical protein